MDKDQEKDRITLALTDQQLHKTIYSDIRFGIVTWSILLLFQVPSEFKVELWVPLCVLPLVSYFTRKRTITKEAILSPNTILPQLAIIISWFFIVLLIASPNYYVALSLLPVALISYYIWNKTKNERFSIAPILCYMAYTSLFYNEDTTLSGFCLLTFILSIFFCYAFLSACSTRDITIFSDKSDNGKASIYFHERGVFTCIFIPIFMSMALFTITNKPPRVPMTFYSHALNVLYSAITFICYVEAYSIVVIKSFQINDKNN
ncbi:MAG: hypothetical protein LUG14_04990 [Synergistaceae bacterium]|nr:hypothetical protein [Synergistaceae bacterium]